jgi:hypothetical protein
MNKTISVRLTYVRAARVIWLPLMMTALWLPGCANKSEPPTATATTDAHGNITTRDDIHGQKVPVTTKRSP